MLSVTVAVSLLNLYICIKDANVIFNTVSINFVYQVCVYNCLHNFFAEFILIFVIFVLVPSSAHNALYIQASSLYRRVGVSANIIFCVLNKHIVIFRYSFLYLHVYKVI